MAKKETVELKVPKGRFIGTAKLKAKELAGDDPSVGPMELMNAGNDWLVKQGYQPILEARHFIDKEPSTRRKLKVADDGEPSLTDLMSVANILKETPALREAISATAKLADTVGSLEKLTKCLEALDQLTG